MSKKPYNDRTDLEKLGSQWTKINGILEREHEWSAAIVRAATAAELAANIAIRKRFAAQSQFSPEFVDSLLIWANGIDGKFTRLITAAETDKVRRDALVTLKAKVEKLNRVRNGIVHRGVFASKDEALEMVEIAREIVIDLVAAWEPNFTLPNGPISYIRDHDGR